MIDFTKYKGQLGRVAVIGAGDLGSHVARAAVVHGATGVLVTGNRRMEMVNALRDEISEYAPAVASQLSDLKDSVRVKEVLDKAERELGGPIETFIITVAYQPSTPFEEQTPDEHRLVHEINFVGPFFFTKYVLDRATKIGVKAHVIKVSSDNSLAAEYDPNTPHYDASKAALNHAVNHLAFHFAKDGHRVNAVLPGWIDIPSQENVEGLSEIYKSIALGRPSSPEEAAIGIIHLAMEPHVTGTIRVVANGGGTNRAHLRKSK